MHVMRDIARKFNWNANTFRAYRPNGSFMFISGIRIDRNHETVLARFVLSNRTNSGSSTKQLPQIRVHQYTFDPGDLWNRSGARNK